MSIVTFRIRGEDLQIDAETNMVVGDFYVDRAMSVSGGSIPAGVKYNVKVRFNLRGSTLDNWMEWIGADRTIAFQRPARTLNGDVLKGMEKNGHTVMAVSAGAKTAKVIDVDAAVSAMDAARKRALFEKLKAQFEGDGDADDGE